MAAPVQATDSLSVLKKKVELEPTDGDSLEPTDIDPVDQEFVFEMDQAPLEPTDMDPLEPTDTDILESTDKVPVVEKVEPTDTDPLEPTDPDTLQSTDKEPVVKKEVPLQPNIDVPVVPVPKGIHYFNPPTDSEIYIPGGICENSLIFFELTLREKPKRFEIEFSMHEAKKEEDKLIHFRYEVSIQDKKAVFYGRSPRDAKGQYFTRFTPDIFTPGNPFDVSCKFHLNSFQVILNDLDPYEFGYTFLEFSSVKISGDVYIRSVHYLFPSLPSPPFCFSIPNGLQYGDYITFNGSCPPDAKIFKIDFLKKGNLCSSPEIPLVQLEVSFVRNAVRKDDGTIRNGEVVLNHWLNGRRSQNPTERRTGEAMIEPGRPFRLDLWMEKEQIVYGLDSREKLGSLRHRRLYEIGGVRIEGDISLNNFHVDRANNRIISRKEKTYDLSHHGLVKSFLKMPVNVALREFFTSVTISGCINDDVHKFEIEMKGSSDDVVYLFTAIMDSKPFVIKQNDKKGGTWGPEETVKANFPFTKGVRFQMEICSAGKSGVIVAVDGIQTITFHNRLDFFGVTSIEVRGDVRIYRIVAL